MEVGGGAGWLAMRTFSPGTREHLTELFREPQESLHAGYGKSEMLLEQTCERVTPRSNAITAEIRRSSAIRATGKAARTRPQLGAHTQTSSAVAILPSKTSDLRAIDETVTGYRRARKRYEHVGSQHEINYGRRCCDKASGTAGGGGGPPPVKSVSTGMQGSTERRMNT